MSIKIKQKESCGILESKVNRTTGTKEWAASNFNFILGCPHDCKWCWAKEMAIRFGRATSESWKEEHINLQKLQAKVSKRKGRIMFPSTSDLTPKYLNESIFMLKKILEAGNEVLIVTKPHIECVAAICDAFQDFKDQIIFRFTIGSADDKVLKYWEPNAPSFQERLESVKLAYSMGYQVSISCEPYLDLYIDKVIDAVSPFVTETIWIGKANNLMARLKINGHKDQETLARAKQLMEWQSDANILKLYERLKGNPLIRWKDSIQKVLERNSISIDANGLTTNAA